MTEKEYLRSIRKFDLDIKRLRRWYFSTIDAYERSIIILNEEIEKDILENGFYKRGSKPNFFRNINDPFFNIDFDIKSTIKKYEKNNYLSYLSEMVLIRIVTLIEILIYEVLVDSFTLNENDFYGNQEITLTMKEFLTVDRVSVINEYVDTVLDKYKRKGFSYMSKYLNKTIGIDLCQFYTTDKLFETEMQFSYKQIVRIHDERHIIIHQNGNTDIRFMKEYGITNKKLKWNEDEIIYKLKLAELFSYFLSDKLSDHHKKVFASKS